MNQRARKCKICGKSFQPIISSMQRTCMDTSCMISFGRKQAGKKQKVAIHARKLALKTRKDHLADAKKALHAFVREIHIDAPCISCGAILTRSGKPGGDFDAGHCRAVGGAKHLELEPMNIHGQCKQCNRRKGGNYSAFRAGLVFRYGLEFVEQLDADQDDRKYSSEQLQQITAFWKLQLKEFKINGQQAGRPGWGFPFPHHVHPFHQGNERGFSRG